MQVTYSHIYLVDAAVNRLDFFATADDETAQRSFDLLNGILVPSSPVRAVHLKGSRLRDVIWTGTIGVTLISTRFVDFLLRHAITGWRTYPVHLFDRAQRPVPDYHGLAIVGRCGAIDDARAVRCVIPPRSPAGRGVPGKRGLYFMDDQWDGSDLFLPAGTAFIFAVERLRRAAEADGITGVVFTSVVDFQQIDIGS